MTDEVPEGISAAQQSDHPSSLLLDRGWKEFQQDEMGFGCARRNGASVIHDIYCDPIAHASASSAATTRIRDGTRVEASTSIKAGRST